MLNLLHKRLIKQLIDASKLKRHHLSIISYFSYSWAHCYTVKLRSIGQSECLKYSTSPCSCWNCGAPSKNGLFCSGCSFIQKPLKSTDYFKLLSVKKGFKINDKSLNDNFKKLQMLLHPDKFSMKSEEERLIAEEFSALVNKAYSTLRQPLSRGIYLLESSGKCISEETTVDDPQLLMEIMEFNEAVADVKTVEDLNCIDTKCKNVIMQLSLSISNTFESNDIAKAENLLIKLRYYMNISSKISERKLEFAIGQ